MSPASLILLLAALLGGGGVALGAWGAHGLAAFVGHSQIDNWSTAVQYQLIHAVALLVLGRWLAQESSRMVFVAALAMVLGVLCFSGSLYGLILSGPRWLGPVTPIGGALLIASWAALFVAALRR